MSKFDNEFPINLDEVWMLVYPRKDHAVRELKENFIEGIDYQIFPKIGGNPKGGRPIDEYHLTISCMEYFIARKVRPVFEVYRQVFHRVMKRELSRKELALMVVQAEEEKERLLQENKDIRQQNQIAQGTIESQREQIRVLSPKASYTDEVLQSTSTYTLTQVAHDLGMRSVHVLLRELCERRVLFRQSGQWQPTAKVAGRGYFETRTAKYVKSDNTVGTSLSTVVTERGRAYLHSMFNSSKN